MKPRTLGEVWGRYLDARGRLEGADGGLADDAVEPLERQTRQLKDRLLVNYSPLVKYVSGRVGARMTGAVDQEDLLSWGILGLLNAIETFDPGRGAKFETYAISKIRWAMLDELRKHDPLPRKLRDQTRESEQAGARLSQRLGRVPTEQEVAAELNLGLGEYRDFRRQSHRAHPSPLDAPTEAGEVTLEQKIADETARDPQVAAAREDTRAQLLEALGGLKDRERLVVTLYFYEGLTLREIGKALDLTEGRISQILRGALGKLREMLDDEALVPFHT